MAGSSLNVVRKFNLVVGDDADTYLEIESVKLPKLEEETEEFLSGGSDFTVDIPIGMKKLEAEFVLKGINTTIMERFGLRYSQSTKFTIYEEAENDDDGRDILAITTIYGRLSIEPDERKRKSLIGAKYMITSIRSYQHVVDGKVLHKFTRKPPQKIINGVDQLASSTRSLGILG
jgi:uncharacterized protein